MKRKTAGSGGVGNSEVDTYRGNDNRSNSFLVLVIIAVLFGLFTYSLYTIVSWLFLLSITPQETDMIERTSYISPQ